MTAIRDPRRPRLQIAGLASSVGKTLVTAGLLGALRRRGLEVQPYKCGPDFLDAAVLAEAAGRPCRNLDLWMVPRTRMREEFLRSAPQLPQGISVAEGVMGVLDGAAWGTSTWDIARSLGFPIVLVLDASASSESVAAQARGAKALLGPRLRGVLVNRVGRGWHATTVRHAVESRGKLPVLGTLPWEPSADWPSRHLGLVSPEVAHRRETRHRLEAITGWVEENVDVGALLEIARSAPDLGGQRREFPPTPDASPEPSARGRLLAVAKDPAFRFLYPENLETVQRHGARVATFSPIAGDPLPPGADAVYLPGGYPELFGRELSRHLRLRRELRGWVRDGRPLLAECGGMMYLLESLTDLEGRRHPMVGAFPGSTRVSPRLGGLGYQEATMLRPSVTGPAGRRLRGHVYHHSVREDPPRYRWAMRLAPRTGRPPTRDGYAQGLSLASYLHVRFDAHPFLVQGLLQGDAS